MFVNFSWANHSRDLVVRWLHIYIYIYIHIRVCVNPHAYLSNACNERISYFVLIWSTSLIRMALTLFVSGATDTFSPKVDRRRHEVVGGCMRSGLC